MKTRHLTIIALATVALSSCSKNDEGAPVNVLPEDGVIRVTAGVNDLVATRGGADNSNLDQFGLFITPTNPQVPAIYTYRNVYMWKNGSAWDAYEAPEDPLTPLTMLWSKATDEVTVIAYQNYNSTATLGAEVSSSVWFDQMTADGLGTGISDLLWAKSVVTPASPVTTNDIYYNTATKSLDIKMNHMLSKLRVNVKYGTGLTQGGATPVLGDVVVSGTRIFYTFNLNTGAVALDPSNPVDIKMFHEPTATDGFDATCEAILVPQTAAFSVKLTVDGKEYTYTYPVPESSTGYEFSGNTLYRLDLTVGKDLVSPGDITASEWTEGTGGSLETE